MNVYIYTRNRQRMHHEHEQALVCLSNREIVYASRGRTFHCKMANNRFFTNRFGLISLAIYPPSIITANARPPSASMDFFNFRETRACSYEHTRTEQWSESGFGSLIDGASFYI